MTATLPAPAASLKVCGSCARELPLTLFKRNSRRIGGVEDWCKQCFSDYESKRRAAKREEDAAAAAAEEFFAAEIAGKLPPPDQRHAASMQEWIVDALERTRLGLYAGVLSVQRADTGRKILVSMGQVFGLATQGGSRPNAPGMDAAPVGEILAELRAQVAALPTEDKAELAELVEGA